MLLEEEIENKCMFSNTPVSVAAYNFTSLTVSFVSLFTTKICMYFHVAEHLHSHAKIVHILFLTRAWHPDKRT